LPSSQLQEEVEQKYFHSGMRGAWTSLLVTINFSVIATMFFFYNTENSFAPLWHEECKPQPPDIETTIAEAYACVNRSRLNGPERDDWIWPDEDELEWILTYIRCRAPFAFTRYADGEQLLMQHKPVVANDLWEWGGGDNKLGRDLIAAMSYSSPHYFLAFPCPDWREILDYFFSISKQPTRWISYNIVFIDYNYLRWTQFLNEEIIQQRKYPIIVIANEEIYSKDVPWAQDKVGMTSQGPRWWETEGERALKYFETLARAYTSYTFLLSVGPMTAPIVHHMWMANPTNQYIGMGSALDESWKGRQTRPYQDRNTPYAHHRCQRYGRAPDGTVKVP
jgi:hypothetical protein